MLVNRARSTSTIHEHDARLMQTLDLIVQPHIAAHLSTAVDMYFLRAVGNSSARGVLRVYDLSGDVLRLGRYHFVPEMPAPGSHVQLSRRHSGGRAVPCGDGFVGISLVLPHRSALVSTDRFTLAPYQVLNRYVRGIMEACRIAGLDPIYPGRDFLTLNHRPFAFASFEVAASSALLFEAIIANRCDFSLLPHLLDAADPAGVVKAEVLTPDGTTSLSRQLRSELATEEIAELLRRGYEKQFGIRVETATAAPAEIYARDFDAAAWLQQRRVRSELQYHAVQRVQLGVLEAAFALDLDGRIAEIAFAGDFIANSPAVIRLEQVLCGCPATWSDINAVATATFAGPENFILGIGPVQVIADTICKGLAT
jgi:lipoate-protein ligase A